VFSAKKSQLLPYHNVEIVYPLFAIFGENTPVNSKRKSGHRCTTGNIPHHRFLG
jgi:hypothetical protein